MSQCPKCDYKTKQKDSINMKAHINAIHKGHTYQCPNCEFKCSFLSSLRRHQKVTHEKEKHFNVLSVNIELLGETALTTTSK